MALSSTVIEIHVYSLWTKVFFKMVDIFLKSDAENEKHVVVVVFFRKKQPLHHRTKIFRRIIIWQIISLDKSHF